MPRKTFLDLSVTQLIGGALAAATAATLGSRLGVVGTVLGASLASVVSAVAGAAYTSSLRRTQALVLRRTTGSGETQTIAVEPVGGVDEPTRTSIWAQLKWTHLAAAAAVVFVISALIITGMELATGRSLDGGHDTTVGTIVNDAPATPTPTPTQQPTPTPTSTPSQTSTPTPTPTPTPDVTATADPSDLPTGAEEPTPAP